VKIELFFPILSLKSQKSNSSRGQTVNKSTLGTILGVGLLSLIKRQSGSSLRLIPKEFVDLKIYFKMHVPINRIEQHAGNEEVEIIEDRLRALEMDIDGLKFSEMYMHNRSPFNAWDRFEPYTQLTLEVKMDLPLVSKEEDFQTVGELIQEKVTSLTQKVSQLVPRYEDVNVSVSANFSVSHHAEPLTLLNGTIEEVFSERRFEENPNSFNILIKRNDDPECSMYYSVNLVKDREPIKAIVNADTGEIYKKPELSLPKLRIE